MKAKALMNELEKLAPPAYALSWDNVGLLIGDPERELHKIYLALDADGAAVDEAVQAGCDMILTHHPLIFSGVKQMRADDFLGSRLLTIAEHRMNYYAMHTNFDVAVMADIVAETIGINVLSPLEATCEEDGVLKGIGSIGLLPKEMSLSELAAHIRTQFALPPVRFYGDPNTKIGKVAVCPGSGKGMDTYAIAGGANVLITGDIDHHYGLDSVEKGLCMIDAGHHGLEHIYVDYMQHWLSAHFPALEIMAGENGSPFHVV